MSYKEHKKSIDDTKFDELLLKPRKSKVLQFIQTLDEPALLQLDEERRLQVKARRREKYLMKKANRSPEEVDRAREIDRERHRLRRQKLSPEEANNSALNSNGLDGTTTDKVHLTHECYCKAQ